MTWPDAGATPADVPDEPAPGTVIADRPAAVDLPGAVAGPDPVPEPEPMAAPVPDPEPDLRAAPAETPQPVRQPDPPPVADPRPGGRPEPRRQSVLPLLAGGIVAGGIGFAAAWTVQQRATDTASAEIRAALATQAERIAALEALPAPPPPDLSPLQDAVAQGAAATQDLAAAMSAEIDRLDAALGALTGQMAEIDTRMTTLERAPAADGTLSQAAITSWQAEIAAMQDSVAAMQADLAAATDAAEARIAGVEAATAARIAEMQGAADAQLTETAAELQARLDAAEAAAAAEQANAADMAALATRRAAMTRLLAALDAGTPFDAALGELAAAGVTPPAALTAVATDGAASMSGLIDSFPEAARTALATARAEGLTAGGDGVLGFLRNQLDVRSVAPREGTDPDAILSRAEAALRDGRLSDALAEIGTLPEVVRADMSGWTAAAQARQDALAAAQALSDSLNLN